jgi:16S rRNA (cytosine1402-N4)-methyltransferase
MEKNLKESHSKEVHIPVMLQEVVEYMNLPVGGVFVDCTIGLAGHASTLAKKLGETGRIIGIDRDMAALRQAEESLRGLGPKCSFVHADFRKIDTVLNELGVEQVDGILLDLGISSLQLDDPARGFSLNLPGPLDMRMDQEGAFSAYDLINSLSEKEISSILKIYGEERLHNRIAHFLVNERVKHPIESTTELRDVVLKALPPRYKRQKIHPATRTFQAFRIAVNRELESLEMALDKCLGILKPHGRICVISFHSLEDRIVKHKFRAFAKEGKISLVFKKPLRPTDEEVQLNSRSRSACLRVAEKIRF